MFTKRQPNAIKSLNPFEAREVLQEEGWKYSWRNKVSIPLKSGRCCKQRVYHGAMIVLVSIPLKSGRCCKVAYVGYVLGGLSQSL